MEEEPTESETTEVCQAHHEPGQKGKGKLDDMVYDLVMM